VQLAREAERLGDCAALGQAEGAVGQVRGHQRGARVVQGQAHGAEGVGQRPGAPGGANNDEEARVRGNVQLERNPSITLSSV
jgi:hypothetical protein